MHLRITIGYQEYAVEPERLTEDVVRFLAALKAIKYTDGGYRVVPTGDTSSSMLTLSPGGMPPPLGAMPCSPQ